MQAPPPLPRSLPPGIAVKVPDAVKAVSLPPIPSELPCDDSSDVDSDIDSDDASDADSDFALPLPPLPPQSISLPPALPPIPPRPSSPLAVKRTDPLKLEIPTNHTRASDSASHSSGSSSPSSSSRSSRSFNAPPIPPRPAASCTRLLASAASHSPPHSLPRPTLTPPPVPPKPIGIPPSASAAASGHEASPPRPPRPRGPLASASNDHHHDHHNHHQQHQHQQHHHHHHHHPEVNQQHSESHSPPPVQAEDMDLIGDGISPELLALYTGRKVTTYDAPGLNASERRFFSGFGIHSWSPCKGGDSTQTQRVHQAQLDKFFKGLHGTGRSKWPVILETYFVMPLLSSPYLKKILTDQVDDAKVCLPWCEWIFPLMLRKWSKGDPDQELDQKEEGRLIRLIILVTANLNFFIFCKNSTGGVMYRYLTASLDAFDTLCGWSEHSVVVARQLVFALLKMITSRVSQFKHDLAKPHWQNLSDVVKVVEEFVFYRPARESGETKATMPVPRRYGLSLHLGPSGCLDTRLVEMLVTLLTKHLQPGRVALYCPDPAGLRALQQVANQAAEEAEFCGHVFMFLKQIDSSEAQSYEQVRPAIKIIASVLVRRPSPPPLQGPLETMVSHAAVAAANTSTYREYKRTKDWLKDAVVGVIQQRQRRDRLAPAALIAGSMLESQAPRPSAVPVKSKSREWGPEFSGLAPHFSQRSTLAMKRVQYVTLAPLKPPDSNCGEMDVVEEEGDNDEEEVSGDVEASLLEGPYLIEGILRKKSTLNRHMWQKRFFVVTQRALVYYHSEKERRAKPNQPVRAIPLTTLLDLEIARRGKGSQEGCRINIILTNTSRVLELMTASSAESERWLTAINTVHSLPSASSRSSQSPASSRSSVPTA